MLKKTIEVPSFFCENADLVPLVSRVFLHPATSRASRKRVRIWSFELTRVYSIFIAKVQKNSINSINYTLNRYTSFLDRIEDSTLGEIASAEDVARCVYQNGGILLAKSKKLLNRSKKERSRSFLTLKIRISKRIFNFHYFTNKIWRFNFTLFLWANSTEQGLQNILPHSRSIIYCHQVDKKVFLHWPGNTWYLAFASSAIVLCK